MKKLIKISFVCFNFLFEAQEAPVSNNSYLVSQFSNISKEAYIINLIEKKINYLKCLRITFEDKEHSFENEYIIKTINFIVHKLENAKTEDLQKIINLFNKLEKDEDIGSDIQEMKYLLEEAKEFNLPVKVSELILSYANSCEFVEIVSGTLKNFSKIEVLYWSPDSQHVAIKIVSTIPYVNFLSPRVQFINLDNKIATNTNNWYITKKGLTIKFPELNLNSAEVVAISYDKKLMAYANKDKIIIMDIYSKKKLCKIKNENTQLIAWSPDGTKLAASNNKGMKVWGKTL